MSSSYSQRICHKELAIICSNYLVLPALVLLVWVDLVQVSCWNGFLIQILGIAAHGILRNLTLQWSWLVLSCRPCADQKETHHCYLLPWMRPPLNYIYCTYTELIELSSRRTWHIATAGVHPLAKSARRGCSAGLVLPICAELRNYAKLSSCPILDRNLEPKLRSNVLEFYCQITIDISIRTTNFDSRALAVRKWCVECHGGSKTLLLRHWNINNHYKPCRSEILRWIFCKRVFIYTHPKYRGDPGILPPFPMMCINFKSRFRHRILSPKVFIRNILSTNSSTICDLNMSNLGIHTVGRHHTVAHTHVDTFLWSTWKFWLRPWNPDHVSNASDETNLSSNLVKYAGQSGKTLPS